MRNARVILQAAGRDLVYVWGVLWLSILDFVVWTTGASLTASLLVMIVGLPVWVATAHAFRSTVGLDRRMAGWYRGRPIPGRYRPTPAGGWVTRARALSRDPQTWRDLCWLILNSTVGMALASAAVTLTVLAVSYIVTPLWWWAVPDPSTKYATLNFGIFTVTSTGWAFVTAGLGLVLLAPAALLNRAVAAGHAGLAARMLGPSVGRSSAQAGPVPVSVMPAQRS